MGQRSQIYIKMENIGKSYFNSIEIDNPGSERWRNDVSGYIEKMTECDKWKKAFGDDKTIIVGFYHQWMYGRSLALIASMLLNMNKILKKENSTNPFISSNWEFGSRILPLSINANNPFDGIKYLQNLISNMFDFELGKYSQAGIAGFSLLNTEDEENYQTFTNFTDVDNNDGVLIFDLIENEYCFVNINGDSTVSKLKYLNPVSAERYMKAYYPEFKNDCSKEDLEYAKESNKPINFKHNTNINKKFLKRFKDFGTAVMTVDDLIYMFPEMEKELLKENTPVRQCSVKM